MSSDQLRILAVDDETSQLEDLARLLRGCTAVEEVECACDGRDALHKVSSERYDAIFLDVRMPDLDGLELGRVLRRFATPPQLVFVSAYDAAAVEAFELHALDYLRKPVSRRRLEETVERVLAAVEHGPPAAGLERRRGEAVEDQVVALSSARTGAIRLVALSEIFYAQSHGDFVRVYAAPGRYLLRSTLSEIEERWAGNGFVRVHRQYLANLRRAVELRPQLGGTAELAFADGQMVPVARRHVSELSRRLRL